MRLDLATWPEIDAYLTRSTGILIPVGSTEQHGPSGLIGTDSLCAEAIAQAAATRLAALVGPVLPVGVAEHHLAFAGSLSFSRETFLAAMNDYAQSLRRHGFRAFYVVNGHGGNIAALREWAKTSEAGEGGVRARAVNWWMGRRTAALRRELYGDREGVHATPSEIAVTQHLFPAAIKSMPTEGVAPAAQSYRSPEEYRARYPDGRVGSDPALATPAHGAAIFASAVEDVVEDYAQFLAG
ncbi:MAG: creatininase family protein [Alphaproteobacteria bacterium]|nr:creatininase family protein [Alphaproteobacteria bacterium]